MGLGEERFSLATIRRSHCQEYGQCTNVSHGSRVAQFTAGKGICVGDSDDQPEPASVTRRDDHLHDDACLSDRRPDRCLRSIECSELETDTLTVTGNLQAGANPSYSQTIEYGGEKYACDLTIIDGGPTDSAQTASNGSDS